jgi:hypothetical protein
VEHMRNMIKIAEYVKRGGGCYMMPQKSTHVGSWREPVACDVFWRGHFLRMSGLTQSRAGRAKMTQGRQFRTYSGPADEHLGDQIHPLDAVADFDPQYIHDGLLGGP